MRILFGGSCYEDLVMRILIGGSCLEDLVYEDLFYEEILVL